MRENFTQSAWSSRIFESAARLASQFIGVLGKRALAFGVLIVFRESKPTSRDRANVRRSRIRHMWVILEKYPSVRTSTVA